MKSEAFRAWLKENYSSASSDTHFYSAKKVESAYGNLDQFYDDGTVEDLAVQFDYSARDAKLGKPNPTKVETGGGLYSNLAGFKSAIRCYKNLGTMRLKVQPRLPLKLPDK